MVSSLLSLMRAQQQTLSFVCKMQYHITTVDNKQCVSRVGQRNARKECDEWFYDLWDRGVRDSAHETGRYAVDRGCMSLARPQCFYPQQ